MARQAFELDHHVKWNVSRVALGMEISHLPGVSIVSRVTVDSRCLERGAILNACPVNGTVHHIHLGK